nr:hypothetical protein [Streptomyces rimosus]
MAEGAEIRPRTDRFDTQGQDLAQVLIRDVRLLPGLHNAGTGLDTAVALGLAAHDLRVVHGVGGRGHRLDQAVQARLAAELGEDAGLIEAMAEGGRVDCFALNVQVEDRLVDSLVGRTIVPLPEASGPALWCRLGMYQSSVVQALGSSGRPAWVSAVASKPVRKPRAVMAAARLAA